MLDKNSTNRMLTQKKQNISYEEKDRLEQNTCLDWPFLLHH